ncbi:MAG TPA: DUF2961 domain-containing protein [Phycisphaerae bacterium]|nr:DUF2961 domain-containing protein [Phycisphaerae bacterium]HOB73734.1 DUF2961 domain-containing protein [Phycisphaerae bacterium]HOJ53392.1 DUF2961 domain-containing protein [Phycisphaerae bacterium]HOL25484.1 DUF2961 domain-containing protein [Phycisphaerae bacterium]HPP19839.1 DUF2961 domain-containing protein [Phycisphaerae bacterium]
MSPRPAVTLLGLGIALAVTGPRAAQAQDYSNLATLTPGKTAAQNGLWIETPLERQFKSGKRVVIAEIQGPATITMIHLAVPQSHFGEPKKLLNRDLLLRAYWDGEQQPSVDCPVVDFFCDPGGLRESVNTALVNKRRGFNAYFPMPFRKSGRIELVYDGPVEAGNALWRIMPCYSYVIYRTAEKIPDDSGYFHACWRQEGLLLGKRDYLALEAKGRGKFVGWNATVRAPGRSSYPVDMNEKWYIDGEETPSIELQGIEDSFGFSWGFPETESLFPMTGWFPFYKGAAAYRFFISDAISFEKSLRVMIGFGEKENPTFRERYSRPGNMLQLSTTCYWYQTEPHAPLPDMPAAAERAPAPEERFWPNKEVLPSADDLRKRGVKLHMMAGREGGEVIFAEPGYAAKALRGYCYEGWPFPVYHTRADNERLQIEVVVPKNAQGALRLYVIDPDNFQGGRRQTLLIDGRELATIENFQQGRWLEHSLGPDQTADGKVLIEARNLNEKSNAVISIVEWVEK